MGGQGVRMEATSGATRGACQSLHRGFSFLGFDPTHPITPYPNPPLVPAACWFQSCPPAARLW